MGNWTKHVRRIVLSGDAGALYCPESAAVVEE